MVLEIVGVALGGAALLLSLAAFAAVRRLRSASGPSGARGARRRRGSADEATRLRQDVAALREQVASGLSRVATVRYDAFTDVGGRASFSVALLDARGDGLVVTAINSRSTGRTYAKPITAGRSTVDLSEEERSAIGEAMSQTGRGAAVRADAS